MVPCHLPDLNPSSSMAMRALRTIIKTFVWSIIIIYIVTIIMFHLPFVQTALGSQISKTLEEKLNTKVTIGKVNLGFLNRIIVDGLTIYDQKSKKMIAASRMAAKIDYSQLIRNGRIYISSAQLFGFNGNFYKQDEISEPNYQFVLDSLASKDNDNKKSVELSINSLVIRHGKIKYDRYDKPDMAKGFNTNHISIKDISAHLIVPYYTGDSLSVNVKKLSFKEKSGLNLRNLSFHLSVNKTNAEIHDFNLRMPGTDIQLKRINASYRYKAGKINIPDLKYDGVIERSKLQLSDISCFVPALKDCKQVFFITSYFSGRSDNLFIKNLRISSQNNGLGIDASGKITGLASEKSWTADIKHFNCDVSTIQDIVESIKKTDFALPDYVLNLGNIGYKGQIGGNKNNLHANGYITTGIGDVQIKANKQGTLVNAYISTKELELNKLLDDNRFGLTAMTTTFSGEMGKNGVANLHVDAIFPLFEYNNYRYRNIAINGTFDKNIFDGLLALNDPNGQITVKGAVNTGMPMQVSDITASVRNLDLSALKITDKWKGSKFDLDISTRGSVSGKDANLFTGNISVNNMSLASDDKFYHLDSLSITAGKNNIYLRSDFGEAEIEGKYKLNTIISSVTNVIYSKLPTLGRDYKKTDNKFRLRANINKSDWLNALLNVPIEFTSPLSINAEVDDEGQNLNLQCAIDEFTYNGKTYRNALITAETNDGSLQFNGKTRKVSDNGSFLDMNLRASAANDKLETGISWNDHRQKPFIGELNAETNFIKNANGKSDLHINIEPSKILVNDTVWTVKPADITYSAGNLSINHFAIEHNRQHLKIDGMATKSQADSITVDIQDVDVKYILDLVNFHSVEFKGYATGKAYIKSVFYTPDLYANLKISEFRFEDGRMGDLYADVSWNKEDKQIDINAHADDENGAQTLIYGNVSPSRNSIDLTIKANNTNIEFLESFCGSFMGDVKAKANGEVKLHGPLNSINLTGTLVADGDLRIKPLNTTYTLINDTIRFLPDNIVFSEDTIRDRNGNIGIINGRLQHKSLTRLTYDISVTAKHMLCYDTHSYGDDTFYGTAYGSGDCIIKGGNGRIDIDIDFTPEKGSFIEYNAASPETISDQQFITWHDKTQKTHGTIPGEGIISADSTISMREDLADIPSDMRINFIINMTPDATLRVLMDKTNDDYIALNGTGSIRASYFNKGSFDMFGTYLIDNGSYKLTIQNIIKKVFRFQSGSTIVFGGDPYNAALNLKALYTINGVPLSDLQIGKSFSSNNVRVDCLMNISGTPQAPRVDFDIELPTVNSDAAQMVRTVINSEEEMNQQVVYLLGVGRFYIQKNNNSAEEEDQQNQTSLAMQSLLSGTISQQINSLLGSIVKNNNWTFGANISTGDEGFNNAEYEGLLSGRLLNNRLIINGQFGYRDNANATTSFIGDFDINYLLLPNGNIALKVYNQTNDRYFTKSSLNTQGIGIIMKKDFNSLMELFGFKKKMK